jgi:hypothetical protein
MKSLKHICGSRQSPSSKLEERLSHYRCPDPMVGLCFFSSLYHKPDCIYIALVQFHFIAIAGFTNLRLLGKLLDVVFPELRRQRQHRPNHLSILRKSALALIHQVKMDWGHTERLSFSPIA